MKTRLNRAQAADARAHADEMMASARSNFGPIDGLEVAAEFKRAVRRCPPDFTREQRLRVHDRILREYLRAIGRA